MAGSFDSPFGGKRHPRLQIMTVAALLKGARPDLPPLAIDAALRRPEREDRTERDQGSLLTAGLEIPATAVAKEATIWPIQVEDHENDTAQRDGAQHNGDDRQWVERCDKTEQGEDYHRPNDHDLVERLERTAARCFNHTQPGVPDILKSIDA